MSKLPANSGDVRDTTWRYRRMGNALLLSAADKALLDTLRPRCACCDKPVETMHWRRSPDSMAVVFTAQCHGETEETVVPFSYFHELMNGGVQGAEAFSEPKRIPE